MGNTLGLSVYGIVLGVFPPIILAIALNYVGVRWFGKTVQMVTYMPYFISTVLIVGILSQMLSLTGPVNHLIENLGGQAIHFMGEPKLFKTLYVFSDVWQKTGYNAVIYISALAAVDQELHEAATVDGANIWQRIRYIDIPSIMPTAVILLIMSCGHILTIGYEKVLLLQNVQFSAVVMVPGVDDEVLDLFLGQTPVHRTVVDDHIDIREFGQSLDTGHLRGVIGVCKSFCDL